MIPPSFSYLFFPFSLIFTECGKAFGLKKNLTDHMKVHTGGRRFMCDTCGQDFSWPNALKVYSFLSRRDPFMGRLVDLLILV